MPIEAERQWSKIGKTEWLAFLDTAGFKGAGASRFLDRQLKPLAERVLPELERLIKTHGLQTSPAAHVLDCVNERVDHLNRTIMGWAIPFDLTCADRRIKDISLERVRGIEPPS